MTLVHFLRKVLPFKSKIEIRKRIYLYALLIRHAYKNFPPIANVKYITTNHNIFSIRQLLMKLRELEFHIFRENATPQLVITDYSKAKTLAVLLEINKKSLNQYLNRIFHKKK